MSFFFLIMGFIADIYPAFYSTAFKPAMALSGSFSFSTGCKMLKNTLIVIQFAVTILLVIVSLFIKMQHNYMQDKSWGIRFVAGGLLVFIITVLTVSYQSYKATTINRVEEIKIS